MSTDVLVPVIIALIPSVVSVGYVVYTKVNANKYGKIALRIVEAIKNEFDPNDNYENQLKVGVEKLTEKYGKLTEAQATEIMNKAIYEVNKYKK